MHWLNRVDVRRMAKPESTVTIQPPCKHFPTGSKRGRHGMIKGLSPIVLEHKLPITFCRVPLSEMRRNRPPQPQSAMARSLAQDLAASHASMSRLGADSIHHQQRIIIRLPAVMSQHHPALTVHTPLAPMNIARQYCRPAARAYSRSSP